MTTAVAKPCFRAVWLSFTFCFVKLDQLRKWCHTRSQERRFPVSSVAEVDETIIAHGPATNALTWRALPVRKCASLARTLIFLYARPPASEQKNFESPQRIAEARPQNGPLLTSSVQQ